MKLYSLLIILLVAGASSAQQTDLLNILFSGGRLGGGEESVQEPEPDAIDFETGDFSQVTSTLTESGNIVEISDSVKFEGDYSARVVYGGSNDQSAFYVDGTWDSVFVQGYFYMSYNLAVATSTNRRNTIVAFRTAEPEGSVFRFYFNADGTDGVVDRFQATPGTGTTGQWTSDFAKGQWLKFKIKVNAITNQCTIWINGVQRYNSSATDINQVGRIYFGDYGSGQVPVSGHIFYDYIEVRTDNNFSW